jgi:hypothetical protein
LSWSWTVFDICPTDCQPPSYNVHIVNVKPDVHNVNADNA